MSDDLIRQKADEARQKCFGESYLFGFDFEDIVRKLGLDIIPIPNLVSEFGIEGALIYTDNIIVVDEDQYDNAHLWNRLRFTLAHELGHYWLHQEFFARRKQKKILSLFGKIDFDPDHDYKRARYRQ